VSVVPQAILEGRGWTLDAAARLGLRYDGERVTIPVRDETGDVLSVLRYLPGAPARLKMLAAAGSTRELFPPPETIGDDEHDGRLWVVEGEPDCIRLWSAGVAAVAVPGVKGWNREDAARFRGPRWQVLVCFDADDEGRESSIAVARDLVGFGVDARVVDLVPYANGEKGFDLTDLLVGREPLVARATLDALAQSAAVVEPEPTATLVECPWRSQPWSMFRDESTAPMRFLVDELWPEAALGFVSAPPKAGKTWVALALALSIATGSPLFGAYTVSAARDVLYVALEGHRKALRARIGALARGIGVDPDTDQLDRLHLLYRPRPFNLADPELADPLIDEAEAVDAALVVVDVLRQATRGVKEASAEDFATIRDNLDPLQRDGRSVALLHHFGKLTELTKERTPGERMAGSGAMYAALDVGLFITESKGGARRLRLEVEARDFASPDPIGVELAGTGSGPHGGFVYTDTATCELDATVVEQPDLVSKLDDLFRDGVWRTEEELVSALGVNKGELSDVLNGASERYRRIEGGELALRAGRKSKTAKPWGTVAMLRELQDDDQQTLAVEVDQPAGLPGLPRSSESPAAAGRPGSPLRSRGAAFGLPADAARPASGLPPFAPGYELDDHRSAQSAVDELDDEDDDW
jgi:hypothetical protein